MSAETAVVHGGTEEGHDAHGTPLQYVMIAVVLVVITALEVGLYYIEKNNPSLSKAAIIIPLLVLASIKFIIVAMYYMHLKGDHPIFRRYFILGLSGAFVLYLVVLASLRIFG